MSNRGDTPDKEALYGSYLKNQRWKEKLFRKGCHKALDIPDDDMQINNHQQGITGRHIVALFGMAMAAAMGWRALQPTPEQIPSAVAAPQGSAQPQDFKVEFWADNGTEIEVQK